MRNETTNTAVPKLRFPEFQEAGEWEDNKLGSVCNITNGKSNAQDHLEGGKYPLFDRSEVIKASDNFLFDCEAVIIPGEGMRFVPKYYAGKFDLHQRAYALKDFSCDGLFVYYTMAHLSQLLAKNAVQSTVLSLRLPILQNFPLQVPSLSEQQKIAATLSSLDDLLTAHSAKLAALQAHKRGLMQGLFPAEGETVPKLRFPAFREAGEWEETTLGKIVKFSSGGTPSKDKPEYWNGETPWISASSMHDYVIDESELYITDAAKKAGAAIAGKGVLLLLVRGSMLFKRIPMGITAREVAFNQDVKALQIAKGIAPLYLLYCLVV